jgi:hypothetical protein
VIVLTFAAWTAHHSLLHSSRGFFGTNRTKPVGCFFSHLLFNGMLPTSRLDVLGIMDSLQNQPWEHLDNNKNKRREGSNG